MKTTTTLTVDVDLLERAKKRGLNMSGLLNRSLAEATGAALMSSDEDITCSKCGLFEKKATLNKIGMTWLCPNEVWICSKCNKNECQKVIIGVIY